MEVTLAGGLVVDVATRDDLAAHHDRLKRLLPRTPRAEFEILPGGAVTGAAPTRPLLMDFGSPPAGMLWAVEWLAIFGNDPLATSAAIANVIGAAYVGAVGPNSIPDAIPPSARLSDWPRCFAPGFTVPQTFNVPDKVFVRGQDHLYVLLSGTGLAAGAPNYHGTAGILKAADTPEILAEL